MAAHHSQTIPGTHRADTMNAILQPDNTFTLGETYPMPRTPILTNLSIPFAFDPDVFKDDGDDENVMTYFMIKIEVSCATELTPLCTYEHRIDPSDYAIACNLLQFVFPGSHADLLERVPDKYSNSLYITIQTQAFAGGMELPATPGDCIATYGIIPIEHIYADKVDKLITQRIIEIASEIA